MGKGGEHSAMIRVLAFPTIKNDLGELRDIFLKDYLLFYRLRSVLLMWNFQMPVAIFKAIIFLVKLITKNQGLNTFPEFQKSGQAR